MATVTIDIPDELKARCENFFDSGTMAEMLTRLLRDALEQETSRRRSEAVDRLLARRSTAQPAKAAEIESARLLGRT